MIRIFLSLSRIFPDSMFLTDILNSARKDEFRIVLYCNFCYAEAFLQSRGAFSTIVDVF